MSKNEIRPWPLITPLPLASACALKKLHPWERKAFVRQRSPDERVEAESIGGGFWSKKTIKTHNQVTNGDISY